MKKISLWLLWGYLGLIYVWTVIGHCAEGPYSALAFAVLNVALGILLFWGENFEISFCFVWARRDSAEADICDSLKGLAAERILSERQLIVAAAISVITIGTSLDWLIVPGFGRVHSRTACEFFSALFTTLTVLWFGQILPKRLASKCPAEFWRRGKWLLRVISAFGRAFNLSAPCDDLVALWQWAFGSRHAQQHAVAGVVPLWAECNCAICKPAAIPVSACDCSICKPTVELGLNNSVLNPVFVRG
jgi:hypothetical protein